MTRDEAELWLELLAWRARERAKSRHRKNDCPECGSPPTHSPVEAPRANGGRERPCTLADSGAL